jgi:hypothetical protein
MYLFFLPAKSRFHTEYGALFVFGFSRRHLFIFAETALPRNPATSKGRTFKTKTATYSGGRFDLR